jgi:hypothetical protein
MAGSIPRIGFTKNINFKMSGAHDLSSQLQIKYAGITIREVKQSCLQLRFGWVASLKRERNKNNIKNSAFKGIIIPKNKFGLDAVPSFIIMGSFKRLKLQ